MPSYPPKKNVAFTITLPILDADGDLVAGGASLTTVVAGADGTGLLPAFAAGPTPTDEGEGFYSIALTQAQMNFDRVAGVLKTTTTGAKNTPFVIYTSVAQVDDLVRATTPANTLDVNATGGVEVGTFQAGAITAAAFGVGAIDATAIATDAIGSAELSSAAANKIADQTLRRTYANARASADGDAVNFRSLLGAIGKLVNKWSISGSTLTITQEDDVTSTAPGGTQAITVTVGADPITALDTT